jgi:hypothetical protein
MVSREKVQIQSGERDILVKKEERDFTKNDINFNVEIYSFVAGTDPENSISGVKIIYPNFFWNSILVGINFMFKVGN